MSDRLSELEARLAELTESHRQLERRGLASRAPGLRPSAARARTSPSGRGGRRRRRRRTVVKDLAAVRPTWRWRDGPARAGRRLPAPRGHRLGRHSDLGRRGARIRIRGGLDWDGLPRGLARSRGTRLSTGSRPSSSASRCCSRPPPGSGSSRPPPRQRRSPCFTAVALAVAARRRLHVLAWLVEVGGMLAAVALMIATGRMAAPVLFLVAARRGVALARLRPRLDLPALAGRHRDRPGAGVPDAARRSAAPVEGPGTALVVQVAVTALYLGSIAVAHAAPPPCGRRLRGGADGRAARRGRSGARRT